MHCPAQKEADIQAPESTVMQGGSRAARFWRMLRAGQAAKQERRLRLEGGWLCRSAPAENAMRRAAQSGVEWCRARILVRPHLLSSMLVRPPLRMSLCLLVRFRAKPSPPADTAGVSKVHCTAGVSKARPQAKPGRGGWRLQGGVPSLLLDLIWPLTCLQGAQCQGRCVTLMSR